MDQIIIGIVIGAGAVGLIWLILHLLSENRKLAARLAVLEATARTRMPHEAKLELMNALAVISHTLEDRSITDEFLKNIVGHINNAIEVGAIKQGRNK